MDLNFIYFIFYFLSTIFLLLSIIYLIKYRRFQDIKLINAINTYIFGLIFLLIFLLIKSLDLCRQFVKEFAPNYYNTFGAYVNYMLLGSDLFIVLMIAICYMISVILLKEDKLQ